MGVCVRGTSERLPIVKLSPVLQQLFSWHAFENGLQGFHSGFCTVLHIQPVQQLDDVSIQPKQPGWQQAAANDVSHGLLKYTERKSRIYFSNCFMCGPFINLIMPWAGFGVTSQWWKRDEERQTTILSERQTQKNRNSNKFLYIIVLYLKLVWPRLTSQERKSWDKFDRA